MNQQYTSNITFWLSTYFPLALSAFATMNEWIKKNWNICYWWWWSCCWFLWMDENAMKKGKKYIRHWCISIVLWKYDFLLLYLTPLVFPLIAQRDSRNHTKVPFFGTPLYSHKKDHYCFYQRSKHEDDDDEITFCVWSWHILL